MNTIEHQGALRVAAPTLDFSQLRNLQSVINPDPKVSSKSPPIPFNAPTAIDPSGV